LSITALREQLAADDSLVGRQLCDAWSDEVDRWLAELFVAAAEPDLAGASLVAVGGYGRREMSLQSDIDVLLLYQGRKDVGALADRLWYPVWDTGIKLGHSVRTVKEALALGASDLDTATALLDIRHLAGDRSLSDELAGKAELQWRKRSRRWLGVLAERTRQRHISAGEVAFLLEPDVKQGRGGLRDVQALRWASAAQAILWDADHGTLDAAYELLLAIRVELHRRTGRPGDRLLLQEQDAVSLALGYEHADDMMRELATAARTIAWTSDDAWGRIQSSLAGPLARAKRDQPLAPGLVLSDGEVHLTDDADPSADRALPLRAAAEAAVKGTRIDRASLDRLAVEAEGPDGPWPPRVRQALVDLLLTGPPSIPLLEALDQQGVWERYLPEWPAVRSKPQRNAYHTFTIDRHLWEAAVQAAALAGRVRRADLLVLGALFHDIGKGYPGDHTEVGIEMLGTIGPRLGLDEHDSAVLVAMCRHHLLLPDVATRRDLDDRATIDAVAAAVGSEEVLELLAALTEADSLATGPAAWSPWKAQLVRVLVARVAFVLSDRDEPTGTEAPGEFPTPAQRELLAAGRQQVVTDGDRLTVVCADRPGLFSRVAGVLALHGLDVLSAAAATEGAWSLQHFAVQSSFGPTFAWDRVVEDLDRALSGQLAIPARLAQRAQRYGERRGPRSPGEAEPEVRFDLDAGDATVVEVHAPDGLGVLYRITRALADLDLDITFATVQTLGAQVVDTFYVRGPGGAKLTEAAVLAEAERALLHALASPV
jgi:[protein-PII] uridylyltransferase